MQPGRPARLQSEINVTPLVDVVLVLLIVFMVVVPQLATGPTVELPETDRPPAKTDDGKRIVVVIESNGAIWIDRDRVDAQEFQAGLERAAGGSDDWQVVIKGDSTLRFGEVRRAMQAVEAAGFKNVGLVAEQREEGS